MRARESFAMTGATKAPGTVAAEAVAVICGQLRGTPCRAWAADMKVHVEGVGACHCPDAVVTRGERDLAAVLLSALPVRPGARRAIRPLTTRPEANRRGRPNPLDAAAQTALHCSRPARRPDACRAKEARRCR
jgi:hypothetical protein